MVGKLQLRLSVMSLLHNFKVAKTEFAERYYSSSFRWSDTGLPHILTTPILVCDVTLLIRLVE